jgi:hypothetical protein
MGLNRIGVDAGSAQPHATGAWVVARKKNHLQLWKSRVAHPGAAGPSFGLRLDCLSEREIAEQIGVRQEAVGRWIDGSKSSIEGDAQDSSRYVILR